MRARPWWWRARPSPAASWSAYVERRRRWMEPRRFRRRRLSSMALLPDYIVPARDRELLERLPLAPNGKIDPQGAAGTRSSSPASVAHVAPLALFAGQRGA